MQNMTPERETRGIIVTQPTQIWVSREERSKDHLMTDTITRWLEFACELRDTSLYSGDSGFDR